MSKSEDKPKAVKKPKTIKVRTVVTGVLISLAIVGAFVAGWLLSDAQSNAYSADVQAQVTAQIEQLKQ